MLTAVVHRLGPSSFEVRLIAQGGGEEEQAAPGQAGTEVLDEGPSPIAPELKELAWGFGAFVVFFLAMRLFLFPRVKQGMQARYGKIVDDREQADAVRAAAEREVAAYQEALVGVRAEAARRIDTTRQTLEAERADRLGDVNARIAERRAASAAQAEEAKAAARSSVEAAVFDVAARVSELAVGQRPDRAAVDNAVAEEMRSGVRR